ncbi:hypothetical protein [Escherichia coli]|uniref:hypothetical protein n=1 Tax=Escherichia coli TaxID=562 RepID=UPI0038B35E93
MKMKPIAVGVCAMLMGVAAVHAENKIAGTEAHADGKIILKQQTGVELVLEEPEKAFTLSTPTVA